MIQRAELHADRTAGRGNRAMPWLLLALLCTTPLCLAAQPTAALAGKVVDSTGKPLPHATVAIDHAGVRVG